MQLSSQPLLSRWCIICWKASLNNSTSSVLSANRKGGVNVLEIHCHNNKMQQTKIQKKTKQNKKKDPNFIYQCQAT